MASKSKSDTMNSGMHGCSCNTSCSGKRIAMSRSSRGILVKLVICVLPGHWKIKIPELTKYIDFGCFLVGYITYNEKKVLGHLNLPISPFLVNV